MLALLAYLGGFRSVQAALDLLQDCSGAAEKVCIVNPSSFYLLSSMSLRPYIHQAVSG